MHMSELRISIETQDRRLIPELFDNPKTMGPGLTVPVPGDAQLRMGPWVQRRAFGAPEPLELILSFGSGVASGLVANWLYAKLKGRPETTLRIEEHQVDLEQGEIKRVITRIIDERRE
jgi:hypothetical protein